MLRVIQFFLVLIASATITTIFASFISTQRVVNNLTDISGPVAISDRISMTFYDITHFGTRYVLFISFAFLIAMLSAKVLSDRLPNQSRIIFICAGAVAILIMLLLMQIVFFGVPIVAGARDGFGLFLQCFCGAIGGYIFYRLFWRRKNIEI